MVSLLLAVLLTACNQADPGSATSGEITVYTAMDEELAEKYLADFKQQYPQIEVTLVRESTGDLMQRVLDENDNPQADVLWRVAVTALLLAEWYYLLEPYQPPGLERIQPQFRDTKTPPSWVGTDIFMSAFCVNTTRLEQLALPMPQSWQALLDPAYEGQLVMPNPTSSGTAYLSVSDLLYFYGEQAGWDFLDQLDRNIAEYTASGSAPCRMAAAGDYAIGIGAEDDGFAHERAGAPIETVFPSEGSGWNVRGNALIKKDTIRPAAQTFLDWAISDEAMLLYAKDRMLITADIERPAFEGGLADPMAQLLTKDIPWAAANRARIVTMWRERYE